MKVVAPVLLLITIIFLFACSSENSSAESAADAQESSNDTILRMEGLSIPLTVHFDRDMVNSYGLRQVYNPMLGQIEVDCGDRIQLRISEESLSLNELKEELLEDQLFKYKFEQETDSELVYLTILPDGTELSYQFMKLINQKGKNILVRSEPMGEYTLQNIEEMKTIVATLVAEEV